MGREKSITNAGVGGSSHQPPLNYLHRDLSTQNQVHILLSIGQMMGSLMIQNNDENTPSTLSDEARLAAEATFIKVCDALDNIVGDKRRWGVDFQLALEKQFSDGNAAQLALMEAERARAVAQRMAAQEISSPHFRYKPDLYTLDDGTWAAYIGDPNDLESGILGTGGNPAEALQAFDRVFQGELTEQMKKLLAQREEQIEKNALQNEHQSPSLDIPGSSTVTDPQSPGAQSQSNG